MEEKIKNSTILIVEDDPVSLAFLREILTSKGANTLLAVNGEEAIKTFSNHSRIDIVLMDIRLPGQDGYEVTRILKTSKPDVPIIAQTAYALEGDREKALNAGCDDYISKPIKPTELFNKIIKFL